MYNREWGLDVIKETSTPGTSMYHWHIREKKLAVCNFTDMEGYFEKEKNDDLYVV